jgi:hypothetical protein
MAEKLDTVQKDKLDKMRDEGKLSPQVQAQDGLLNPEVWDEFDLDARPYGSEMQRISKGLQEVLNEHFSQGGKYSWRCGFFVEGDPRITGLDGWRPLQRQQLGQVWSEELQRQLGLHEYEGAICWGGRGMFERHIVCVITEQHRVKLMEYQTRQHEQMLNQPDSIAGEQVEATVTEQSRKFPVSAGFVDERDATGGEN